MLTTDFNYDLPQELIAQTPADPRDSSRLLILDRHTGKIEHRVFHDILDYLHPGDVLVANESRVIPARLHASKVPTGGKVELLLLARRSNTVWESLVKGRKVDVGQHIAIHTADPAIHIEGEVTAITPSGGRLVDFGVPIDDYLDNIGIMPLPPYIHTTLENSERYQTVYSRVKGSVAAPTAGLHFTPALCEAAQAKGVEWVSVILHIGLDTFRPVSEDRVEDHQIHSEYCQLNEESATRINTAKKEGRRIIAVGTTSVRVLESAAQRHSGLVESWDGATELFIYPGFKFQIVDALITNFHLPKSSLLMLVSALAGQENIQKAYHDAVEQRYRFFSFGDAMFIH